MSNPSKEQVNDNEIKTEDKDVKNVVMKGTVLNTQQYSLHDGPGIRTTVFLKGCPLKCIWCHNPESIAIDREISFSKHLCISCNECEKASPVEALRGQREECVEVCPTGALEMVGKEMTVEEVLKEIEKDRIFFEESRGGVTFSGGEPLMQWEFVYEVAKACKDRGIHTAIDTSGYGKWEAMNRLREVIDFFLYDLKHLDSDRHMELTGVSNRRILENLERLAYLEEKILLRIPIIPGINDDDDHLFAVKKWIASIGIREVRLLPYHKTGMDKYERIGWKYRIPDVPEPKDHEMQAIKESFQREGLKVKVGG